MSATPDSAQHSSIQFPDTFGTPFQETIIYCLLTDVRFAKESSEILEPNYFKNIYLQRLSGSIFKFKKKYKVLPSLTVLRTYVRDEYKIDKRLRDGMLGILDRVFSDKTHKSGASYTKENTLNFCRVQKLDRALVKAHTLAHLKEPNFDNIRRIVHNGLASVTAQSLTDYKKSFRDRVKAVTVASPRTSTGLPEFDDIVRTGGVGVPVKKLCIVMTFTSGGKTHFLVNIGAMNIRNGKTVLHLSLEDDENEVSLRYDSNLSGISAEDFLLDTEKQDLVERSINQWPGQLFIKEYPGRSVSILTIRNHIDRMIEDGHKPDVVIVDYISEIKPSEKRERRQELADISRDLRALAVEYELTMWTAAQSQRGTMRKNIVKLEQIGESFEATHPTDLMITIGQTSRDVEDNVCKLYIAKNKMGTDSQVYVADYLKNLSRFRIREQLDASTLDIDSIGFSLDS